MKTYYGNYLGLVVNSSDPEYRGRVQIFVPHVMPALYDGWNKEGADIQISCVGSNIPEGLTSEIHERLVQILPWAEAASPIIGGSAPGNLFSGIASGIKQAVSSAATALNNFIQTPTSNPVPSSGSTGSDLANTALNLVGTSTSSLPGTDGGNLGCAAGVSLMFKKATGNDIIPGQTIVTGTTQLYSHMSKSSDFVQVPTNQIQPGDILVTARGQRAGHTGIYVGDGRIVSNSSNGFAGSERGTLQNNYSLDSWEKGVVSRNPNQSGVFRYIGPGSTTSTAGEQATQAGAASSGVEGTASSAASAPPNPQAKPVGHQKGDVAPTPQTTMTVGGPGTGAPAGTVSGGGTATNSGVHKGKTIVSATGVNGSGLTTVTYSDGTTATLNQPRPIRNNNPGNLEYGSFAKKMGAVGSDGRYAVFPTAEAGASAKVALLKTSTYQNLSIRDAFNRYAPPSENPNYLRDLQSGTGFDMSRKMSSLSVEEFNKLTSTVAKIEGFDGPLPSGSELPPSFSTPNVVNNTDSNGRTPVVNTNDMASGLFAYPNPGAMVWVFFREGNPLYPVYFAASYSSAEWSSAYRGSSPSESYTNDGQVIGTGTVMHFGPEGGIKTQNRANINDPLDNNSSLTLFHQHGSGITMKNGCDFYRSAANKRDEVDNDRHTITRGYKEEWTQGDESTNVRGDTFIKVGNISQEAIDAMNELSEMSYKLNQQLMEKPKS